MPEKTLADQVAVVVGGSKGIGRAVSILLATAGASVAIVSRERKPAEEAIADIAALGGQARWFCGNYMDASDMTRVAGEIEQSIGPSSVVVAGGGPGHPRPQPFMQTPPEDYESFFLSRCLGRLFVVRAFAPQMIAQGRGKIVLLTTDAGRIPTKSEVLNGAAAAATIFATRALAKELTPAGLRINAVSTTLTTGTPSFERFEQQLTTGAADPLAKTFDKIRARSPLGELNAPEDVAQAVLFLASPASDQISGAILSVNGGLSLP